MIATVKRVAIIDDDEQETAVMGLEVQDASFEPVPIKGPFKKIEKLIDQVKKSQVFAVVCDHRLRPKKYANFDGALVVATLQRTRIPAILVTQFTAIDADVTIREHRRDIPVVLRKGELDAEQISSGIRRCVSELEGVVPDSRRPYRTLVEVLKKTKDAETEVVDVLVPNWRVREAVRFPVSLVPKKIRGKLKPGIRLLAQVNIGAETAEELFFSDLELALPPTREDGLGPVDRP